MSERYYLTGCQVGILKAIRNHCEPFKEIDEILKEVMDKQFIGNMPMPYEDYGIVIVKKEKLPEFIKDGICTNKGKIICNLGYACDACPFNYERVVSISLAVDEGNTHITKLERHLIEEEITKTIEQLGMKVKKFEMP